ncbi:MAG: hypothetical protein NVSMB16_08220 [Acidimicrobiales bacterium]
MPAALHLLRRFFGALWPGGPPEREEVWVAGTLGDGSPTHVLWRTMSGPDRRHAVAVARRAEAALGADCTPEALTAALLHDVGKVEAGLGTLGRVPATLVALGGARRRAPAWSSRRWGARRRVGLYLRHAELGAVLLREAGAPVLASTWAAEHHRPPSEWTIPAPVGAILKAADDD